MKIVTGNSNPVLAQEIVAKLGMEVSEARVSTFSDGESDVQILRNMRGKDVYMIQPTCPPVNHNLMELLLMADALKRASAGSITAVIPYYGYARQDRKVAPRVPISAKLVADLIQAAGVNRLLTMDLHADQIQGFFDIPVDHLYGSNVLIDYLRENLMDNLVIVTPDAGGTARARAFAKRLEVRLVIIDKRRSVANQCEIMNIIGDVKGMRAVMLDDMVDTAGTLCEASVALIEHGAAEVYACCTHALLSGNALDKITASPIKKLIVGNSIPLSEKARTNGKIEVVSMGGLFADAIKEIHEEGSVSKLFGQ